MTLFIFTGPTLSLREGEKLLEAVFLPPATQGDVYRAASQKPAAIGIIDGYFERVPSVSHKEILWAMAEGVHVLGAASMGALRAAELSRFGMQGVGAIYEAYASCELEADDEVAVAHAMAEEGYRPLSEAMVNIRATLRAAEEAGVIPGASRVRLEDIAKQLFYADRCYPVLLQRAAQEASLVEYLDALRSFLQYGRVDQKRLDALALLETMSKPCFASAPMKVRYAFERTDAWEHIREQADRRSREPSFSSMEK